jgi:hypothetical protein
MCRLGLDWLNRDRRCYHSDFVCYHFVMNSAQRKVLQRVFANPLNGNIEWSKIESLLKAVGCRVVEGAGSSVTFDCAGRKLTVHRPHPQPAALRYRVLAVRDFLKLIGHAP